MPRMVPRMTARTVNSGRRVSGAMYGWNSGACSAAGATRRAVLTGASPESGRRVGGLGGANARRARGECQSVFAVPARAGGRPGTARSSFGDRPHIDRMPEASRPTPRPASPSLPPRASVMDELSAPQSKPGGDVNRALTWLTTAALVVSALPGCESIMKETFARPPHALDSDPGA